MYRLDPIAATATTVAAVSTPTPTAATPSGKTEGGEAPAAPPVIVDHPKEDDNSLEAAPLLNALSKSAHRLARKDSKKKLGDDGSASFSSHVEEDEEVDDDDGTPAAHNFYLISALTHCRERGP